MIMKSITGATCICLLVISFSVKAALVSRLGGQAVYDTDLDITWLADANLAADNAFGVAFGIGGIRANGTMSWDTANDWITAMNADGGTGYLGFNDWRLPTTLQPDASCSEQSGNTSFGLNCTGSEMGHLFYNELSGVANTPVQSSGDPDLALFSNIQTYYWSTQLLSFGFHDGFQDIGLGVSIDMSVWAVRSGDVSAVPVPAAVWLFGSGLIGLIGVARRKKVKR